MKRSIYLLILGMLILAGCGKKASQNNNPAGNNANLLGNHVSVENSVVPSPSLGSSESPSDKSGFSDVILVVGNKKFSTTDFKNWLYFFYLFQGYKVSEDEIRQMWNRLSSEDKTTLFRGFVREMVLSSIARERGIDKDPSIASKIKVLTDHLLGNELLDRETSSARLSLSEIRDMYEEAVSALDRDIKAQTNTFTETEFVKRLGSLLVGVQMYMINKEYVVYKIEVNSATEADKVMGEYYNQKALLVGQKNANIEAFREIARKRMGIQYKDKISTYKIMEEIQQARQKGDKARMKYWQDYYQLLTTAEGSTDPVKGRVGNKWFVILIAKKPEWSVVHWDELPSEVRNNIQTMLIGVQEEEKVNSLISDFRKRSLVQDDLVKPDQIIL